MDTAWNLNLKTESTSPEHFQRIQFNSFLLQKTFPYPPADFQTVTQANKFPAKADPSNSFLSHQENAALPFAPLCMEVVKMDTEEDTEPKIEEVKSGMSPQLTIQHEVMRTMELQKWQLGQMSLLLEVNLKLEQLKAIRTKLKGLKKDKKTILKVRRKVEQGGRRRKNQQQQQSTSCDFPNTQTSTPSANTQLFPTNSSHNSSILWRPIEFPCSPSPSPASTPVPVPALEPKQVPVPAQEPKPVPALEPKPEPKLEAKPEPKLELSLIKPAMVPEVATPLPPTRSSPPDIPQLPCDENDMVTIGPNGTKIPRAALQKFNWSLKETYVTRKILMEVFDGDTLASHNLTGKPSPAFLGCNKPLKGQLDPLKVADVVHIVTKHLNITEKEVRQTITIKCADENKRMRNRLIKMLEEDAAPKKSMNKK